MKQKIKLTGDQAEYAFKTWTKQHGLLERADYVGVEKTPGRAVTGNMPVAFVELDLDTFKVRLCKLKEAK